MIGAYTVCMSEKGNGCKSHAISSLWKKSLFKSSTGKLGRRKRCWCL